MNKLELTIINTLIKSPSNYSSKTNLLRSVYHLLTGGAQELNTLLDDMVKRGVLQVRRKGKGLIYSAYSTPSELLEDTSSVVSEEKIAELRERGGKLCPMCKGHGYVPRSMDTASFNPFEQKEVDELEQEEVSSILEKLSE